MNANWRNKAIISGLGLALLLLVGCEKGNKDQESSAPTNPNPSVHSHATQEEAYTCPMHPQIVQENPGSCPICGMDLVRKATPEGDSLMLNADLKALLQPTNSFVVANIATVRPERRNESTLAQANGIITYDTRRLYTIPTRFSGRVEKLYVRFNYQPIRKGQKLLEVYSPDIVTAQREFLYLLDADPDNAPLISASKQKLRLLGSTDGQIADLVRTRKPSYSLAVYSPYDGYVIEESGTAPAAATPVGSGMVNEGTRGGQAGSGMSGGMGSSMIGSGSTAGTDEITFSSSAAAPTRGGIGSALLLREGQYVQTGQTLFKVVNPSRLWAEFQLYNRDAVGIKPGDGLTISFDQAGLPPQTARVSSVVPFEENGNPFVTIRAYLPNDKNVRVGQLARADIRRKVTESLWLPATAVLDLGNVQVVFVQQEKADGSTAPVYRPVRVQIGSKVGEYVAIRHGVTEAQIVAHNAQFLIDSESFVNVIDANQ